jgi:hypothetical protein
MHWPRQCLSRQAASMILKSLLSVVQHGLSLHGHQVEETVDALLLHLRRWAGHAVEQRVQVYFEVNNRGMALMFFTIPGSLAAGSSGGGCRRASTCRRTALPRRGRQGIGAGSAGREPQHGGADSKDGRHLARSGCSTTAPVGLAWASLQTSRCSPSATRTRARAPTRATGSTAGSRRTRRYVLPGVGGLEVRGCAE